MLNNNEDLALLDLENPDAMAVEEAKKLIVENDIELFASRVAECKKENLQKIFEFALENNYFQAADKILENSSLSVKEELLGHNNFETLKSFIISVKIR